MSGFLCKGSEHKICVLTGTPITDIQLPAGFVADLRRALPRLSHSSICFDVLNEAFSRENFTRLNSGGQQRMTYAASYTILAQLLLRPEPWVRPMAPEASRRLSGAERRRVLALLYDYGVQCVTGECCGLVPDPLPLSAGEVA